jgi:hypothetical protein
MWGLFLMLSTLYNVLTLNAFLSGCPFCPYSTLAFHILFREHHGRVVNTPDLYLGGPGFKSQPGDELSC